MINGSLPVRERNIPTDLKEAGYKETLMDEDMSYSSYLWFYGDFILLLPCVVVIANGIHNGAFLFEKDVQERVVKMGLITKKEIDCNRILYKICTMVVMIAYVNPIPQINTKIHYWFAENEQKARKADIKYMKEFFPDTVFGKYPNLGHAGLVLLKPELFAEKIRRL